MELRKREGAGTNTGRAGMLTEGHWGSSFYVLGSR